jgi:hypothetical protein
LRAAQAFFCPDFFFGQKHGLQLLERIRCKRNAADTECTMPTEMQRPT